MEPSQHTIIPASSPAAADHPLTSSNLSSNMLCPISAPQLGQEVIIIKNSQQLEGVLTELSESHVSSNIDPTPVRLSGEYKESEYGMLCLFSCT